MIQKLKNCDSNYKQKYDICIIGSGPAGSTVLKTILDKRSDLEICVLESGDINTSNIADELRHVLDEGLHIKPHSRERIVGGASTTWAGLSAPYDPIDFQNRDFVFDSEWPISRSNIMKYHDKASTKFGFPPVKYFDDTQSQIIKDRGMQMPSWEKIDEKLFLRPTTLPDFKMMLVDMAENNEVDLYTQATVSNFTGNNNTVGNAVVRDFEGQKHNFEAKYFVLACGGIENPRILLNSSFSCEDGLGNEHDQVGRYFMNHPKGNYGKIKLSERFSNLPYILGSLSLDEGYSGYFGLRVSDEVQLEREILNSYVRLYPIYPWSSFTGSDDLQFKTMYDLLSLIPNVSRTSLKTIYSLYERFGTGTAKTDIYGIRNFIEMEPREQNRVILSNEKDRFGIPKAKVCASLSELEKRSLIELQNILEEEISKSDWGTTIQKINQNVEPWPIKKDASHHMGTTRMGNDPSVSVVDKNCKIHSCHNMYICGSSIFPTSGNANPTWTIVSLAIRLGEHLYEDVL